MKCPKCRAENPATSQFCDGLAEAHSLGVVHRDLKPQNIMIDKNGNAKIMDFGIARSVREKGITGPSVLIGTPEYMSPEQAEAKEVDQQSDIYSLGLGWRLAPAGPGFAIPGRGPRGPGS
jgi:serine/threonine protein kinase